MGGRERGERRRTIAATLKKLLIPPLEFPTPNHIILMRSLDYWINTVDCEASGEWAAGRRDEWAGEGQDGEGEKDGDRGEKDGGDVGGEVEDERERKGRRS